MKISKTLFCLSLLFLIQYSYAQVKFRWVDVRFIDKQTISAKIFVQNFGNKAQILNKYGAYSSMTKFDRNFFIEYDVINKNDLANYHYKTIPSSITIETNLGTSLPMEQPVYNFYPTGSTKGEYWDIIFVVPRNIANIKIKILSRSYSLADTPEAIENENIRKSNFISIKESKVFNYQKFHPDHYAKINSDITAALIQYSSSHKEISCQGSISYLVNDQGETESVIHANDVELKKYVQNLVGHFRLKRTGRYGYNVKAQAQFNFIIHKGKFKAKYSKTGELEKVISAVDPTVLKTVDEDISKKGTYKITYQYLTINGEQINRSGHNIKKVPKATYIYWGIPIIIGTILAIAS